MNFIISIIRTLFRHRWLILVGTGYSSRYSSSTIRVTCKVDTT